MKYIYTVILLGLLVSCSEGVTTEINMPSANNETFIEQEGDYQDEDDLGDFEIEEDYEDFDDLEYYDEPEIDDITQAEIDLKLADLLDDPIPETQIGETIVEAEVPAIQTIIVEEPVIVESEIEVIETAVVPVTSSKRAQRSGSSSY